MDFRIMISNGTPVLLERIEEDDVWLLMASVFIDKTLRFDEWIPADSADEVCQQIAEFTDQQVIDFLTRANEWAAKQYQQMAANINMNRGKNTVASA